MMRNWMSATWFQNNSRDDRFSFDFVNSERSLVLELAPLREVEISREEIEQVSAHYARSAPASISGIAGTPHRSHVLR